LEIWSTQWQRAAKKKVTRKTWSDAEKKAVLDLLASHKGMKRQNHNGISSTQKKRECLQNRPSAHAETLADGATARMTRRHPHHPQELPLHKLFLSLPPQASLLQQRALHAGARNGKRGRKVCIAFDDGGVRGACFKPPSTSFVIATARITRRHP
jgi:hypothetical protein